MQRNGGTLVKKLEGYMAGVNLGGWLSQYLEGNLQRDPEHHFDRFITKEDIEAFLRENITRERAVLSEIVPK